MKLGYGLTFSLRAVQLVVISSVTYWRSHVWSTRTMERETSTSSTSWWRVERKIYSAGLAWRETANTTVTWCRSVKKNFILSGATKTRKSEIDFSLCLLQGDCAKVSSINDKSDWKMVRKALSVIEFSESDIEVRCAN